MIPTKHSGWVKCYLVYSRTVPHDDSGVSHILEHTVLCGSQKYPCRDPFMKMAQRSQATFMNAFTAISQIFLLSVYTSFKKPISQSVSQLQRRTRQICASVQVAIPH
ncbi:unnamed protein product [Schistosoma mattheei]|uniref:Uncharacterized protein n=1 Tax=Schistosoma mattheei TaxID=31246 RepID=A0A183NK60_9TREM|nr:unnamed protein product [Schistosoma mattheei]